MIRAEESMDFVSLMINSFFVFITVVSKNDHWPIF